MGREVRRVPLHWKHPSQNVIRWRMRLQRYMEVDEFFPMFDRDYEVELADWEAQNALWVKGEHPDQKEYPSSSESSFEDWWGRRPDPDDYFPKFKEPRDGWCVYETVSEGTPVTPVFATADELIDYLVENGDFWDQTRRREGGSSMNCDPWPREQAEKFVRGSGWKPSLTVVNGKPSRFMEEE